jgi:hypothetical protein
VDHGTFFTVFEGELVDLERDAELPADFTALLIRHVERFLDRSVMTLGSWADEEARPNVLTLDAAGGLISLVAVRAHEIGRVRERVRAIDSWLSAHRLRDLGASTDDPAAFYEGLWDLSPDASITLAATRRYVLLTAVENLEIDSWAKSLPDADIELQYFDVFHLPHNGPPIFRRRNATAGDVERAETAVSALADVIDLTVPEHATADVQHQTQDTAWVGDSISGDETTMPLVDHVNERIDEPQDAPSTVSLIDASVLAPMPQIRQGATFDLDRLPLLFDPLGADLTSISDELFAVDKHVVIVDKLPERRRRSPFADRSRFRWDATRDRIALLSKHRTGSDGSARSIHLFVETDRQSGYGVYVGLLRGIDFEQPTNSDTAWFSIDPKLDLDLYRMLRKGKLPEHIRSATIDFGTLDA